MEDAEVVAGHGLAFGAAGLERRNALFIGLKIELRSGDGVGLAGDKLQAREEAGLGVAQLTACGEERHGAPGIRLHALTVRKGQASVPACCWVATVQTRHGLGLWIGAQDDHELKQHDASSGADGSTTPRRGLSFR